jgi:hypothetical protein
MTSMTKTELRAQLTRTFYWRDKVDPLTKRLAERGILEMTEGEAQQELEKLKKLLGLPGMVDQAYVHSLLKELVTKLARCGSE